MRIQFFTLLILLFAIHCEAQTIVEKPGIIPGGNYQETSSEKAHSEYLIIIQSDFYNAKPHSKIYEQNGKYYLSESFANDSLKSLSAMAVRILEDTTYIYSSTFDTLYKNCDYRIILVRDGAYSEWNANGILITTGQYKNNYKTGIWSYFDSNLNAARKEEYFNGKIVN